MPAYVVKATTTVIDSAGSRTTEPMVELGGQHPSFSSMSDSSTTGAADATESSRIARRGSPGSRKSFVAIGTSPRLSNHRVTVPILTAMSDDNSLQR